MKKPLLALALLSSMAAAQAAPQAHAYFAGSTLRIDATNSDVRTYNCAYSVTFKYQDFGQEKTYTDSGFLPVSSATIVNGQVTPWSGNVVRLQGTYVQPQITSPLNYNCT